MKRRILIFSLLVSLSMSIFAQKTIYLDKNKKWVKKDKAEKYALVTNESDNSIKVELFDMDGTPKSASYYQKYDKNIEKRILNGRYRDLYKNGKDSLVCYYKDNERIGQADIFFPSGNNKVSFKYKKNQLNGHLIEYFENGKIRRKEFYKDNKCISGVLLDEEGKELEFYPYFLEPEFVGGLPMLMQYLALTIRYPIEELKNKIQGRILVQFVIEKDGKVSNPHVINGGDYFLQDEALRVVKAMPDWTPGRIDGKLVRVQYTLPVVFRLQQ